MEGQDILTLIEKGIDKQNAGMTSDAVTGLVNDEEFGTSTTIEFFWPEAESRSDGMPAVGME